MTRPWITTGKQLAREIANAFEKHPFAWTRHQNARDRRGAGRLINDPEACRFCLVGAAYRAETTGAATSEAAHALVIALHANTGSAVQWNDAPGRTVAEVVAKLREIGEEK